jgi:hypothetical protein
MKMKYVYAALIGLCGLFCTVCSCSTEEAAAQIIGGASSQAPVFLACKAVSETEIDFQFSQPVRLVSLHFSPVLSFNVAEQGSTIRVQIDEGPGPGEKLTADLLVEDERGNTVNALVPLRTRNSRIPAFLINELRTEYSTTKTTTKTTVKVEYIELKMLSGGNMGAVRLFIAGTNKNPLVYEFPPIEIGDGEYVLLHLRTLEEDCRDELGGNLDESGGTDAVAGVRDIWVPGTTEQLRKTEAVYILDQDDAVIDAVMLAEKTTDALWGKDALSEAADFLFRQGAWKSAAGKIGGPADAVDTSGVKTALTRSLSRYEDRPDTNTAADWYLASGTYSPGQPNR